MRATIVKARVNFIHTEGRHDETKLIDCSISFSSINLSKIILPHYNALVLTLCINGFDVHRVLVDPSNATYLLQLLAFNQMRISLDMLNLAGWILSDFNGATTVTLGDVTLPVRAISVTQQVMFSIVGDLGPYNALIGWA